MKGRTFAIVLIVCLFWGGTSEARPLVTSSPYVPNELIVELAGDASPPPFPQSYGNPQKERLFPHVGGTSSALAQRHRLMREKFPRRSQRQTREIPLPPLHRLWKWTFPGKPLDMEMVAREVRASPEIKSATPNYYVSAAAIPNDSYYSTSGSWGNNYDDLWGLKKIQTEAAWDTTLPRLPAWAAAP